MSAVMLVRMCEQPRQAPAPLFQPCREGEASRSLVWAHPQRSKVAVGMTFWPSVKCRRGVLAWAQLVGDVERDRGEENVSSFLFRKCHSREEESV